MIPSYLCPALLLLPLVFISSADQLAGKFLPLFVNHPNEPIASADRLLIIPFLDMASYLVVLVKGQSDDGPEAVGSR